METKQRTTAILSAIIAALAIAAGALWYAHEALKTEQAQLLDAHRALGAERDVLKTEAQPRQARIGELDNELKALQRTHEDQVAEAKQLGAAAAETRLMLEGTQAELKQQQQLQEVAQQRLQALNAEKEALTQKLSALEDQAKASAAAGSELTRELASARQTLDEARAHAAKLNTAHEQLQKKHSELEATDAARQAELKQLQQLQEAAQQRLQALNAEKEAFTQKVAQARDQVTTSAAAGASLSRELSTTRQTLDQARARSAELNRSYEQLLKNHSRLTVTDAALQAELARTKTAFEEAQTEVARLTGARGIYTVQNGDSLSSIAAYFYRNGNRWPDIHKGNDFLTGNPDLIYAGQVLIIPK